MADYWKPPGNRIVTVTVPVEVESRVVDLETGREVTSIKLGQNSFMVDLDSDLARVFCIDPKT